MTSKEPISYQRPVLSPANKILVIDNDPALLKLLTLLLEDSGFQTEVACTGKQALELLSTFQPHLIIADLHIEESNSPNFFKALHKQSPSKPVIILTTNDMLSDAEKSNSSNFSYLNKPFKREKLLDTIETALSRLQTSDETKSDEDNQWRTGIISQSSVMENLLEQARRIAKSDVSVLIQSDSGTGKELLAQAIHKASLRADAPFIPINCAAIPETLLESELFGHKKGAFTGANHNRTGLFETANGGTLFLDEIGNMPLEFQNKLLRVLEDGKVRPVGSTVTIPVDVRIISATHTDLEAAVEAGDFREDLFYRINIVTLELPPLRDRREDIPRLANHFLQLARKRAQHTVAACSFSPEAMEALMMAPWPGNIRQLLNVVEQVVALSMTSAISAELIHNALGGKTQEVIPFVQARTDFEHDYLVHILQMTQGNVTQAAHLAQRNRTEFYKLLNRHHLEPKFFRRN